MENLINEKELNEKLEVSPEVRVTADYMKSRIKETRFERFAPTVTICQITLDNGFSVRGESACVKVENYNKEIGEKIAYDNAFDKLWTHFGFLLAESLFKPNGNGFRDSQPT